MRKRDLQDDIRFRMLRLLQEDPELSQRELARKLGVSTGGTYYALRALLEKGLIKIGNFTASKDKRRYAYIITSKGLAEKTALAGRFLRRKLQEHEALLAEIKEFQAELTEHDGQEHCCMNIAAPGHNLDEADTKPVACREGDHG